jgi:hypothetical protein
MGAPADLNLESYYMAATNRARRFVASRYMLEECLRTSPDHPNSDDGWREVWRVSLSNGSGRQDFILAIPYTFPDRLPKVYLPASTVAAIKQIPHLDSNRFLCGFDEVTSKSDADNPGGVALSVLERAVAVFGDGVSGVNNADYATELQAYWALDSKVLSLSLVNPDTTISTVSMLRLRPSWRGYSYLFALTEAKGKIWLKAVGCNSEIEAQAVPFLHLQTLGDLPLPRTNGELYTLLQRQGGRYLDILARHLQQSPRPSPVFFSAPTADQGRMLGVWWHPIVAHEVNRGPGHQRRHAGVVPGFGTSPHKSAVMAELSLRYKQAKIDRGAVERVDKGRLLERTAGTTHTALEHGANIIGCGSVGSVIAAFLAQSGLTDKFRIVDPEILGPENVQRHYCGMSDIGEYKAEATAKKLRAHFPHLECIPHTRDILDMIRTSPASFSAASLTVVTVADIAIERRINRLYRTASTFGHGPLCFLWVEPHLLAGHALLLRRGQAGCFECAFDQQLRYRSRVLSNPASFTRREAGCQSTFIPYSGVDATQFIAAAARFLIQSLEGGGNRLFTWLGGVEEARASGVELEPQWHNAQSFSSTTTVLSSDPMCVVCGLND